VNCAVAVAQLVRHRRINFVLRISDVIGGIRQRRINFLNADYAENGSVLVNSADSAIVLLINRKDYEHFSAVDWCATKFWVPDKNIMGSALRYEEPAGGG